MSALPDEARPALLSGVRLREDPRRGWVLLAPERVLLLDETAAAVLAEIDGARSFALIVERLSARFAAPREEIARDAGAFLRALADQRMARL
ncbi:MAG: pyrroloquinoline quinone biosynthesis peptide chaperone PqqD [Pseudomonadota bacterium]